MVLSSFISTFSHDYHLIGDPSNFVLDTVAYWITPFLRKRKPKKSSNPILATAYNLLHV